MTHNEWSQITQPALSAVFQTLLPSPGNTTAVTVEIWASVLCWCCRTKGTTVRWESRNLIFTAARLLVKIYLCKYNYWLGFILVSVFQPSDLCQYKAFVMGVMFPLFKSKKTYFFLDWACQQKKTDLAQFNRFSTAEGQLISGHETSQQQGREDISQRDNMNRHMTAVTGKIAYINSAK